VRARFRLTVSVRNGCANCDGKGCACGVKVPPACDEHPRPPEEMDAAYHLCLEREGIDMAAHEVDVEGTSEWQAAKAFYWDTLKKLQILFKAP